MATYAVGDVQGCLKPLQCLLEQVHFDPSNDCLWLAGDMINRGPESLETLRFLYGLGDSVRAVLGNHDLHFLAVAFGYQVAHKSDTLQALLEAHDRETLIHWLRQIPLIHTDPDLGFTMVHAGIPPHWSLPLALQRAEELANAIRNDDTFHDFLSNMYGDTPSQWNDLLPIPDRLRLITNYFTRMRFCTPAGALDLKTKTGPDNPPAGYAPWFGLENRLTKDNKLIFGHWAALQGKAAAPNVFALDTGCVWGGELSLLRLEDEQLFHCSCD